MRKVLFLISFFLIGFTAKAQLKVIHFNASWNDANKVEWVSKLKECDVEFIDIAPNPDIAKKYGVVVVPTIIIFEYDEEVYRYQADLSFKLSATKEEVQDYIDELVLGDF
jgi:hypothetical protein